MVSCYLRSSIGMLFPLYELLFTVRNKVSHVQFRRPNIRSVSLGRMKLYIKCCFLLRLLHTIENEHMTDTFEQKPYHFTPIKHLYGSLKRVPVKYFAVSKTWKIKLLERNSKWFLCTYPRIYMTNDNFARQ